MWPFIYPFQREYNERNPCPDCAEARTAKPFSTTIIFRTVIRIPVGNCQRVKWQGWSKASSHKCFLQNDTSHQRRHRETSSQVCPVLLFRFLCFVLSDSLKVLKLTVGGVWAGTREIAYRGGSERMCRFLTPAGIQSHQTLHIPPQQNLFIAFLLLFRERAPALMKLPRVCQMPTSAH